MAKRYKRKKNTYLWYALYAVAGYYAYSYWSGKPVYNPFAQQTIVLPPPTA